MADRSPPARGGPASASTLALYELLYRAGEPQSIPQIKGSLTKGFTTDARVAYADFCEQDLADTEHNKALAWDFWVRRLVKTCRSDRFVITTAKDGRDVRRLGQIDTATQDSLLLYAANPDKAPTIKRTVWREETRIVPWTPDALEDAPRHIKGVQYRDERLRQERRPKLADALALLALADDALGVRLE